MVGANRDAHRSASGLARTTAVLHVLAIVLALIAVCFMIVAIAGMATGRQGARAGWLVRLLALVCFVAAVVLNVAAHSR